MKKLLIAIALMFTITTASAGWFSKETELMYTLNKIESALDHCMETQDKAYCWQVSRGNPFMIIPLNGPLWLELDNCLLDINDPTYECEVTRLRIEEKFMEASYIAGPDMELLYDPDVFLDDKGIINE